MACTTRANIIQQAEPRAGREQPSPGVWPAGVAPEAGEQCMDERVADS